MDFTSLCSTRRSSSAALFAIALSGCSAEDTDGGQVVSTEEAGAGGVSPEAGSPELDSGHEAGEPEPVGVTPAPEGEPYQTLAEWNLFADAPSQMPNEGVIPYTVNAALFSDFASKHRFLWIPEGQSIGYEPEGAWRFPVGTILIKTFAYLEDLREPDGPERLLETRLLVHESGGWEPQTYVWNESQTEATRKVAGDILDTAFIGEDGIAVVNRYVVPNLNECRECHGENPGALGGKTRQLDGDNDYGSGPRNQIDHIASLGLFDVAPEPAAERQTLVDPFGDGAIDERVRAYFDANCGHCHNPGDSADSGSGLWLDYANTDPATRTPGSLGVCKIPTSAGGATCGLTFDIVPGDPDSSILVCRLASEESEVMMPPLGRNLVHSRAVELVTQWITALPGSCQ